MKAEQNTDVRHACTEFLAASSRFYNVPDCSIRVLVARPLRIREHWTSELFGDYAPESMLIRVWMRTAVRKEVTSFGTFLSTVCHEFCHHLDFQRFGFTDSWHTRGFYERVAALQSNGLGSIKYTQQWPPAPTGQMLGQGSHQTLHRLILDQTDAH